VPKQRCAAAIRDNGTTDQSKTAVFTERKHMTASAKLIERLKAPEKDIRCRDSHLSSDAIKYW
jgi:hypothetical protein